MSNPNNCKTCDYTKLNANRDGHCYMFRDEPTDVCMQHTGRKQSFFACAVCWGTGFDMLGNVCPHVASHRRTTPNASAKGPGGSLPGPA